MLQYIRERAQGIVAWIIVGFIVVLFALWGIQDYLGAGKEIPVAEVNDKPISKEVVQSALAQQRQILQQQLGPSYRPDLFPEGVLRESVMESLIEREVLVQTATDSGLRVSDAQLGTVIRSMREFQDEDGKFSPALYERLLRSAGYTPQAFLAETRTRLLTGQLTSAVSNTAFVTPAEVQQYLRLQNQKRDFGYLVLPAAKFAEKVQVSEDEIKSHYEANQAAYTEPEKVKLAYVELSVGALAGDVQISDTDVKAYYDSHQEEFTLREERRVRHILFSVKRDADESAVAATRSKAEATLAEIRAGKDFAELAKAKSEDPGSAKEGGVIDFFGRNGQMDPAFEAATFALAKGEVSEPVRSNFGFHIIKLEDVRGGTTMPLAEAQATIQTKLRDEKARERFYELADQLANLAYEHPDELKTAADGLGLPVQHSPLITRAGGPGLFANEKVREAAFSEDVLESGNNSDPVDIAPDHIVVLRVEDRQPSAVRPLAEVREQIAANLRREKAREAAVKAAEQTAADLNAGKIEPAAYAKSEGLEWKRQEAARAAKEVPADVVQLAFRMPRPDGTARADSTSLRSGDQAVVVLYQVLEGEIPQDGKAPMLQRADAEAMYKGVLDILRSQADIRIHRDQL